MKLVFIFCCFITYTLSINAQSISDYFNIDKTALNIPLKQTTTTADIAGYINAHFKTEAEKVRAAYTWVAASIRYNSDSIKPVIFEEDREQLITSALARRKGVCENYASLFNDICLKAGLKSLLIEGYTKQHGVPDKSAHAWCAVSIDNKWNLYDPTWDEVTASSGALTGNFNYDYFALPSEDFIQTHMPFDPMFQMLNAPVTYKEFNNGNVQLNKNKTYFNYEDSISAYRKADELNKYLSSLARIQSNGLPNTMTVNKINKLKMYIEIIYQDRDTTLYNGAIADYNYALQGYNTFINYRNNKFLPSKSDDEVQLIFKNTEKQIAIANNKLTELNRSKANLALNTAALQKALDDLSAHITEQQNFLKEYQSSAKVK